MYNLYYLKKIQFDNKVVLEIESTNFYI